MSYFPSCGFHGCHANFLPSFFSSFLPSNMAVVPWLCRSENVSWLPATSGPPTNTVTGTIPISHHNLFNCLWLVWSAFSLRLKQLTSPGPNGSDSVVNLSLFQEDNLLKASVFFLFTALCAQLRRALLIIERQGRFICIACFTYKTTQGVLHPGSVWEQNLTPCLVLLYFQRSTSWILQVLLWLKVLSKCQQCQHISCWADNNICLTQAECFTNEMVLYINVLTSVCSLGSSSVQQLPDCLHESWCMYTVFYTI